MEVSNYEINCRNQLRVQRELKMKIVRMMNLDQNKLYGCEVSRSDHLERREGGGFDAQEYDQYPERYISTFNTKIAPCNW